MKRVLSCLGLMTALAQANPVPDSSADRLAAIPATLQQWVNWGELAGAVTLVAQDGKIREFDAVGFADLATHRAMKKDDLFWIASMTKPMTAAAILLLADEGELSLDDPVEKYLPAFKNPSMVAGNKDDVHATVKPPARAVTIRDLLAHTHGLKEPPAPPEGTALAEVVEIIARSPLQFEPGSQWKYGNAGMSVLGRIVEVVSGVSYPDFLQTRFFDPLGMADTTFFPTADQLKRLAVTYKNPKEGGALEKTEIFLWTRDLSSRERTVSPGGGLFSTAEDIFKFYQMLLNGGEFSGRRYLASVTVKEMFTPQTGDKEAGFSAGMNWGLGIGIVRQPQGWTRGLPIGTINHDGAYGTTVMLDPGRRLLFIMMIQRAGLNPARDGLRFRYAFTSAVMQAFAP